MAPDLLCNIGNKCKLDKFDKAFAFDNSHFPVDFESAIRSIHSMSDQVAKGPMNLLTGPQAINCTTPGK